MGLINSLIQDTLESRRAGRSSHRKQNGARPSSGENRLNTACQCGQAVKTIIDLICVALQDQLKDSNEIAATGLRSRGEQILQMRPKDLRTCFLSRYADSKSLFLTGLG